ncbi:MAG: hemerythrin domain-containing protein [Sphingomonadales bacterium]|nr:hemerythrin domain-containing protein [Sphingomonadales bacterium]
MAQAEIFQDLIDDHETHRTLLDLIEKTHGDSEGRRELFERFQVEVRAHAAAEEESLYASMLAKPDLNQDAKHSVSEHKEIEDIIAELFEMDMSSSGWLTRFKTLKHDYLHHIDEEEEEMFPAAAEGLSETEKARITKVFENRKPKEKAKAKDVDPGDDRE